jgi:cobalt-zinc-cadmium efflux system outer membrane protein
MANLVRCALQASLELRAAEAAVQAADGRVQATEPWLPTSPELAVSASRRSLAGESALNWSASLGVELEIAGQRSARRDGAVAERQAQQSVLTASERAIAAEALRWYFELLSAREASRVLGRLEAASSQAFTAAQAAAERGAAAGIEAEVMDAARLSVQRRRLDATRDEAIALASLANLVGASAEKTLEVTGSLEPLAAAARVRIETPLPDKAEVVALAAERRAALLRASALRRSRAPNPTLSVFVQREGFAEDVVGVGLAFPLPLPEPLGRMSSGAIAESEALAKRAAILAEKGRRTARTELAHALAEYEAARAQVSAVDGQRTARAEATLANLTAETQSGRVPVRDVLVLQQPLLELLLGAIEAKKAMCLASIEVVRASGLPLDGSER